MSEKLRNEWVIENGHAKGKSVFLLTLDEFKALPLDTKLIDIFGNEGVRETADDDTRAGYVAWGLVSTVKSPESSESGQRQRKGKGLDRRNDDTH